jgi:hypothetical protein
VPHTVRNESPEDAVALQVHAPGGPMEGFIRSTARLAADRSPAIEEVPKLAEAHGIEMLGPVPADAGYGRVRGAT